MSPVDSVVQYERPRCCNIMGRSCHFNLNGGFIVAATHSTIQVHASKEIPFWTDIIGHHFGNLTVVEFSKKVAKNIYYRCQCDCGNHCERTRGALKYGLSVSCGCIRRQFLPLPSLESCPPFPDMPDVAFRHCAISVGYAVSSDGSVWSCRRRSGSAKTLNRTWHKLKSSIGSRGYRKVRIDGNERLVCHLVTMAFHGPRPEGMVVRHLDGDQTNDAQGNLIWGTESQNQQDSLEHGTHVTFRMKGNLHPNSKLKETDIPVIRKLADSLSSPKIARQYGVSSSAIRFILERKTWKHIP